MIRGGKISSLLARIDSERVQRLCLLGAVLALCLAVVTRFQLANGFTILPGDRYDAVIVATILEHWSHVFSGDANWSQVNYFFPYTRTIAHTDAYFLIGVAYFPFRSLGLDPFISIELAGLVIKSFGFFGTYLLCRRAFSFSSFFWALVAAILFTVSNGMTNHGQRVQLATVALAPIMALLLWNTSKTLLEGDFVRFRMWGLFAGMFLGAWSLTCFYMAWFFTFFITAFALVVLALVGRKGITVLKERITTHYGSFVFVVVSALISQIPFIYAFLPKSMEVGVRAYEKVATVPLEEVLQVGTENILFGHLYNYILSYVSPSYSIYGEYYNTGFAVVLFFLFLCGCIQHLKQARQTRTNVVLPSLAVATLITWSLALNIGGHSAWYFVYQFFPGAKALSVIAAYQLFLALPVVIIAVKYLSEQHNAFPILLLCVALLVAEELNIPHLKLDRKAELTRISLPQSPPKECHVFYVSGWDGQSDISGFSELDNNIYAHNVTAMIIAQITGIPTINGIASFNPPDWNFSNPNRSDYDDRMIAYARTHNVTELCRLDLNSKRWSRVNDYWPNSSRSSDFLTLDFKKSEWPGVISNTLGLSSPEQWGTWSSGESVTIEFTMPLPEKFNVHLITHAFGPNVGKEFVAHVGESSAKFILSATPQLKLFEFINPKRSKIIRIDVPLPTSPKNMGLSGDERSLGIAFTELRISHR